MYIIFENKGKQYLASPGDTIKIDLIKNKKRFDEIVFDKILMKCNNEEYLIGKPYLNNMQVRAEVSSMGRDGAGVPAKKIKVFKKKRRKGYHKTIGHRQKYIEIKIKGIESYGS